MTFRVGSSLVGGIRRTANRNGLVLALAYVAVGTVWQVLFYSAIVSQVPRSATRNTPLPTVPLPTAVAALGAVVSLLLLQYLTVVSIRTFVGGHSRLIPAEYYTRNIGFVLVNAVVGSIALGIVVLVGFALLVVPGIVAYVAFLFVLVYITAEDRNVVSAFRDSWRLTRGHWLRLFLLLLAVLVGLVILPGVLSTLTQVVVSAVLGVELGTLLSGVIVLPFSLVVLGILAEAFTQLRDDPASVR
jgi:hypothetical protein